MHATVTLPGPEALILFGVHVKVLSALFGIAGIGLGHLMAPVPPAPIGWRRQSSVIAAGLLVSLSITIATGQQPLVVLSWSIGIGFSGITLFQGWGARAGGAARTAAGSALDALADRLKGGDRP